MKITNKHNLPEPVVKAVVNDTYSKGGADYTATGLIAPIQLEQLARRHDAELSEDVIDRIWMLLGRAVHFVIEQNKVDGNTQEKMLFLKTQGRKIKGQPDQWDGKTLTDYKVTSVWKKIFSDSFDEWEAQLNLYAEMLEASGEKVEAIQVMAIYRDWSEREAKKDQARYPQTPAEILKFKLWPHDDRMAFLDSRVALNIAAEDLPDDQLPECSKDERWAKESEWAVWGKGKVKCMRKFKSESEAEKMVSLAPDGENWRIEFRPGENTRCERYCAVKDFCAQYRKMKGGEE